MTHWYWWLWNFERPKTVVKVKKSSIESKRMKRDITSQATSVMNKIKVYVTAQSIS